MTRHHKGVRVDLEHCDAIVGDAKQQLGFLSEVLQDSEVAVLAPHVVSETLLLEDVRIGSTGRLLLLFLLLFALGVDVAALSTTALLALLLLSVLPLAVLLAPCLVLLPSLFPAAPSALLESLLRVLAGLVVAPLPLLLPSFFLISLEASILALQLFLLLALVSVTALLHAFFEPHSCGCRRVSYAPILLLPAPLLLLVPLLALLLALALLLPALMALATVPLALLQFALGVFSARVTTLLAAA